MGMQEQLPGVVENIVLLFLFIYLKRVQHCCEMPVLILLQNLFDARQHNDHLMQLTPDACLFQQYAHYP